MAIWKLKACKIALAVLMVLGAGQITLRAADKPQSSIDATVARVVKARDYTAQFVVLAKKSFKEGSPEYNQAFKLYAEAFSDYNGWNAYVASALASGRIKDKKPLPNDSNYDDISASAVKSATAFVSYVDSNTQGQSKAVVAILSQLADFGLKLWAGISTKNAQDRAAASKRFVDATTWQSWEQIKDGSVPPVATSKNESTPADSGKSDGGAGSKPKPSSKDKNKQPK